VKIASRSTTRNILKAFITAHLSFPLIFVTFIRDGRSGRDESDSSISKPAELKAEKSRKEEELKLQEEEELQLALALSQSEIEHKKQTSKTHTQRTYSSPVKVHFT
jgi:hypothetical protein